MRCNGVSDRRPYLVGYDYARPESEIGLTESPDTPLYTDLYRHPDKRDHGSTGFKKRFDLFALGSLLCELALWEPLVDVLSRHSGKDWTNAIQEAEVGRKELKLPSLLDIIQTPKFDGEISHAAGPTFCEAIHLCVHGDTGAQEEFDVSLHAQRSIVHKLQQLQI